MNTHRLSVRPVLAFLAAALCALPAFAARKSDDVLSLVPGDAAAVAVVRWNEVRASALGAKLLSETDHVTADGDAARFMAEARRNPKEDVDVIVIAGSPAVSGSGRSTGLVLFEGRFDTDRLSSALVARGGVRKSSPGGEYYLLPQGSGSGNHDKPGAVAFAGSHLTIAGDEASVIDALARRNAGGADFASRAALGRNFSRIAPDASAWALIDVKRFPISQRARAEGSGQAGELLGALKSVSVVALQAAVRGEAIDISAAGVTDNDETRQTHGGLDPRRRRHVAPGRAGEVARGGFDAAALQDRKRRPGRDDRRHPDRRLPALALGQTRGQVAVSAVPYVPQGAVVA
jgi:hypothetical protein